MYYKFGIYIITAIIIGTSFFLNIDAIQDYDKISLKDVYSNVKDSVVKVSSNDPITKTRMGSGFLIDKEGHILTNHHIVAEAKSIDVTFPDGTIHTAKYIGSDGECEPAIIKLNNISNLNIVPLNIGNSSRLNVGDTIYAIGNSFGLGGEITKGIVTAKGISIKPEAANLDSAFSLYDIIQTDASINLVNYGGPLVNEKGELVGMNTQFPGLSKEFSASGFAIPLSTIKKITPSLISKGHYVHPWLGISGTDISSNIGNSLEMNKIYGFYVMNTFPNSPSLKSGIMGGDVIVEIDNTKVLNLEDITSYIQQNKDVDDSIKMTVLREGKLIDINLVLEPRPIIIQSLSERPSIY